MLISDVSYPPLKVSVHIGNKIREILKEKRRSNSWLANEINTSRQNVTEILERESINTGQLKKISEALEYDFFQHYMLPQTITETAKKIEPKMVLKIELELTADQFKNIEVIKKRIISAMEF